MDGFFITFEGMDGAGKTTQSRYLRDYLERKGYTVVFTREPGGTPIGEQIRDILLDPSNAGMSEITEALLYAAARAEHVRELILPSLQKGFIVISDRFLDSSIAYQGYGRNLGNLVTEWNEAAVQNVSPDVTFYLDLSPEEGISRVEARTDGKPDRMEQEEASFKKRVYQGFQSLAKENSGRIVRIDGSMKPEEIRDLIFAAVDERMLQR
ncbi:MAG: dTMP kinase [Eubacteriales bacterium]|nr:dTMP kinase [Eubacteriales bacterium]